MLLFKILREKLQVKNVNVNKVLTYSKIDTVFYYVSISVFGRSRLREA